MAKERIDKILASQGFGSRKEVHIMIYRGQVMVNGNKVTKIDFKADAENDDITLNGRSVTYKKNIYIMMNKPQGVVSATSDKKNKTVLDLVPPELSRKSLFVAGRLDKDVTGFIFLTDNGDFAHKLISPKSKVYKTYIANLDSEITDDDILAFKNGIHLETGQDCLPAILERIENHPLQISVKVCEGKFHQVKRMFLAINKKVLDLKRSAIGGLELDENLKYGECREITKQELEYIFN